MKLPKDNQELTEIFENARTPKVHEFDGEYYVDMLTTLPSLRRFSHRKVFYAEDNKIVGHNILFNRMKCGNFFLEEGVCRLSDALGVVVINYKRAENSFITNRVMDYVREIKHKNLYLGRFNYLFMGKLRFLGYFSLSKV